MGNHFINMFFYLRTLILLTFSLFIYSCNTTEPEDKPALSFADASCTEVWLEVTGEAGKEMQLLRDGKEAVRFTLQSSTQIIFDDSLTLKTEYEYQLIRTDNGVKSNFITAKTLDTTSHSFSWQKFTFGDIGSSVLYDCAIISGNNIWCVGEILIRDTSENGYTTYNAIHWNGNEWELKKISVDFRGNQITPPLESVHAFSENDIWFVGSLPIHGDGNNWTIYDIRTSVDPNLSVSKAWGFNSNDIYFAGIKGNLVRYYNGQWIKMDSRTELNINDIYGAYNKVTNEYEILAVASNVLESLERDLLEINDNTVQHLSTEPIQGTLRTVWFHSNKKYYIAGGGIYQKNSLHEDHWQNDPFAFTSYSTNRLRGIKINDIVAAGGGGELLHYNGINWQSHITQTGLQSGNYYGIDFKDNIIVAVGPDGPSSVITIGRR